MARGREGRAETQWECLTKLNLICSLFYILILFYTQYLYFLFFIYLFIHLFFFFYSRIYLFNAIQPTKSTTSFPHTLKHYSMSHWAIGAAGSANGNGKLLLTATGGPQ